MKKYRIEEINSIAKDMKYEALYWALGFEEKEKGVFVKVYENKDFKQTAEIHLNDQYAVFPGMKVTGGKLRLNSHEAFVVLECADKLLSMGYNPESFSVNESKSLISGFGTCIHCFEWNHCSKEFADTKNEIVINYSSRLVSGIIEREYYLNLEGMVFDYGFFERKKIANGLCLGTKDDFANQIIEKSGKGDFEFNGKTVAKYSGNAKCVTVPEGVTELASSLFWDNQNIEEVILPESLESLGGDTFYNCKNLKHVNIPANVRNMGNNPFAGCPLLELKNESEHFALKDGVLYTKDFSRLIYYPVAKTDVAYKIHEGTKIIGKHAFYLCNNLMSVYIPESVIKLENNPFSGCEKLELINHSERYKVSNSVIYDADFTSVIGCLNSIKTDELHLRNVKRICRNSFWNCKGIKKIILPVTLEQIGYNPFVGCSNIEFVSESPDFIVENGILFNKDKSKIICCPSKAADGTFKVPDSVTTLERGAFSGAENLTEINLNNVSIISKSCFTNCTSLKKVYCSDFVSYIGEWAFAHCKNLKDVSVLKDCYIDKNALLNTPAAFSFRDFRSNYVIESDNLYTLQTLKAGYSGKIKSILIDPPYNSNIDYIGYKDNNFDEGYQNFIQKRVEICLELLTEDGFLVVNIDEGGLSDIEAVCKRVFGAENVIIRKWKKKHPAFDVNRVEKNPNKKQTDFEYIVFASKSDKAVLNKVMQPYFDGEELKEKEAPVPEVFDCFGTNSSAKDEIAKLFGSRDYFSTPKPVKLIKELCRATTDKDSIVLDFFAGSGTTGQAVFELNTEDNGKRKFILVSNNESNICRSVTMKRMNLIGIDYKAN